VNRLVPATLLLWALKKSRVYDYDDYNYEVQKSPKYDGQSRQCNYTRESGS